MKDYFIPVSRMFGWVSNSIVLSYWSKLDKKMTRRLIDSIVDSVNIWLNGLTAEEKLASASTSAFPSKTPLMLPDFAAIMAATSESVDHFGQTRRSATMVYFANTESISSTDGGPYGEGGHGQRRVPCGIAV